MNFLFSSAMEGVVNSVQFYKSSTRVYRVHYSRWSCSLSFSHGRLELSKLLSSSSQYANMSHRRRVAEREETNCYCSHLCNRRNVCRRAERHGSTTWHTAVAEAPWDHGGQQTQFQVMNERVSTLRIGEVAPKMSYAHQSSQSSPWICAVHRNQSQEPTIADRCVAGKSLAHMRLH